MPQAHGMNPARLLVMLPLLFAGYLAAEEPIAGPPRGTLFIHGGGRLPAAQLAEFIRLVGGPEEPFVVLPGAAADGDEPVLGERDRNRLRKAGVKHVVILHTRDRAEADSEAFVAPLLRAKGVWIGGGRQWRLADAFLGTRTLQALHGVLARGGVIGGSSAGATIQGSYLVRGAPEGNTIMMAKGHEEGFGFLRNCAIDQHVVARKREADLVPVVQARPGLLGLGIDEGTALIVTGDVARVFGAGQVLVHDPAYPPATDGKTWFTLGKDGVLDLRTRRPRS